MIADVPPKINTPEAVTPIDQLKKDLIAYRNNMHKEGSSENTSSANVHAYGEAMKNIVGNDEEYNIFKDIAQKINPNQVDPFNTFNNDPEKFQKFLEDLKAGNVTLAK